MIEVEKLLNYIGNNVSVICEEQQNKDYGGCVARVDTKMHRVRIAKRTPKKTGQFVAIWEKDSLYCNSAFSSEEAPDFLTIFCIQDEMQGVFVFPREVMEEKGIYRTASKKGKMAFRLYPPWDHPTGLQAVQTQKWQAKFFSLFDLDESVLKHEKKF